MFYSLKADCFFRKYGKVGYVGRPIIHAEEIVSESGAVFLQCLTYELQNIDAIVDKLVCIYNNTSRDLLKADAISFFNSLVKDGFLYCVDYSEKFKEEKLCYSTLEYSLGKKTIQTNCEKSSAQFLSEHFKDTPFLNAVHIELTSKCNENCIHCFIPPELKISSIDRDLMISILNQCREMEVLDIGFSGGEPMLHPDFCEFLKHAKDLDFNVTVLSNLTLLNKDIEDMLLYKHPSCVKVSLYSMDSVIHDQITMVEGSQKITKHNIEKLVENGIPVQINCPVLKQNKDSFDEVINWGQSIGCTVSTDYLIAAREDGSIDNLQNRLSKEDLDSVITKILTQNAVVKSDFQDMKIDQLNAYPNPDELLCGIATSTLCIVSNGDVYPCAGCQRWSCGNANFTSIRDIWSNSPLLKYLRTIRRKDFKKCTTCKDKDFCSMCMARNSNEDPKGDLFSIPEITCSAANTYHRLAIEFCT